MAAIENLEFYKEGEEGEKIVKEKKIERETSEQLAKEVANVVSGKSEYKQIVVWWNVVKDKWNCTFRTCIIPLEDTTDSKAVNHPGTPLCLFFEYGDKEYWIMRVEKVIDEKWNEAIEGIREIMRGALEAEKKQEPGF